jgi:hypothetical protein
MTKEIPLTQGKVALVDDEDYDRIVNSGYHWRATYTKGLWYATAGYWKDGKMHTIIMHRFILGLAKYQPFVDHVDGDGLNNCRANMREVTHTQNMQNRGKRKGSSQYKGVRLDLSKNYKNPWRASIRNNGVLHDLGRYATEQEAACAYDREARNLFGEYARTNF